MTTNKRIVWLDNIKGFAILSVVLGHVLLGYIENNYFSDASQYAAEWLKDWIYTWHMSLFMILSGFSFGFAYIAKGALKREKVKRQIINILELYLIFQSILVASKTILGGFVDNSLTIKTAFLNIFYPNTLMWYLYVLFFYYLFFAILISKKGLSFINKPVFIILCLVVSIGGRAIFDNVSNGFTAKNLFYYFFFFSIGIKCGFSYRGGTLQILKIKNFSFSLYLQ